jgi:hypothetical protein
VTAVNIPTWTHCAPDYLRIRDTPRSEYYQNEVAQSHHLGARLSGAEQFTNTNVHHLTEIEKRP